MRLLLVSNLSEMLSTLILAGLTVAAASDLAPLAEALEAQSPGQPVTWSFGSSGQLRRQIEGGAPFDLYLSANEQYVRELEKSGRLLKGSVRLYGRGRLGIWGLGRRVDSLQDLLRPEIRNIAVPNPAHAPYGVAAVEMLKRAGLFDRLRGKLLYGENVRQAYEYARTGNADAVITSWTMLHAVAGAVRLPAEAHPPVLQTGGVVAGSPQSKAAVRFLEYLLGPAGQAVLRKGGLDPP